MGTRKLGTFSPQTIRLKVDDPAQDLTKQVTGVVEDDTMPGEYLQYGWIRHDCAEVQVGRRVSFDDRSWRSGIPWKPTNTEPIQSKPRQQLLNGDERDWLDRAILAYLSLNGKPVRTRGGREYDRIPDFTASEAAEGLFRDITHSTLEHLMGTPLFGFYRGFCGDWDLGLPKVRKQIVGLVRTSLKRLTRSGSLLELRSPRGRG